MTPILLLFFSVSPVTAVATDLWFAAITKLVGSTVHQRAGAVDWQVVRRLWGGSLPAALLVVLVLHIYGPVGRSVWMLTAIGCVILVTAAGLLAAPALLALARGRRLGNPVQFKRVQPALTVVAGGILGVCVAVTSIGAGALGSAMLLYLYPLRMTPHRLVATDIVHAIPLTLVAGLGYLMLGRVDVQMLVSLLSGSLPAVLVGGMLAGKLPGRGLQILLAVILAVTGFKILM